MHKTKLNLERWRSDGFIHIDRFLSAPALAELRNWIDDIESWLKPRFGHERRAGQLRRRRLADPGTGRIEHRPRGAAAAAGGQEQRTQQGHRAQYGSG